MAFFKRIFLFAATNIAIMAMVTIVIQVLGIGPQMTENGLNYGNLMAICLVWGMVGSLMSLMMSKQMAYWFMGVKRVENNPHYSDLVATIHQIAQRAGMKKMPDVGVYASPEVNAFATGPSKNNSLVAVSEGLLRSMSKDEVEGVLAHEVSHIVNGDMVTMTLIQGVVNAFVMFGARVATFAIDNFLRGEDDEGQGLGFFAEMACVIFFQIVFGLIGAMITGAFSRGREYRADKGAASLVGSGKMIAALRRLQSATAHNLVTDDSDAVAALKISSKPKGLMSFLATHPPLEDRISALQGLRS